MPATPATLHRIWLGGPILPGYDNGQAWRDMMPSWEHRLWTDEHLEGWPVTPLLHNATRFAPHNDVTRWKVNILRLAVLHRHGGIYIDCDTIPLRPLDDLLEHAPFVAQSPNAGKHATNAVMGFPPEHPYIGAMLDGVNERVERLNGRRIHQQVGGTYLNELLGDYPDVQMLPWWQFTSTSINDRQAGRPPDPRNAKFGWCDHTYQNSQRRR